MVTLARTPNRYSKLQAAAMTNDYAREVLERLDRAMQETGVKPSGMHEVGDELLRLAFLIENEGDISDANVEDCIANTYHRWGELMEDLEDDA